jgi:uncharacterized protein (DUF1015 family)
MILHVPHILLPEGNWEKWAVIACDQHTQDIEYWKRVEEFVGNTPSTLNMIYPEIYLPLDEARVKRIHENISDYKKILIDHGPCFILIKRSISGVERTGIVAAVDLEGYEFNGSDSFIRPTEGTIKERLPARVKIRENADLELSHILVLYDDPQFSVIPGTSGETAYESSKVYDFELMEGGGHITGYKLGDEKTIKEISEKIGALELLLVGDGNHSLAAAKSYWESIKGTVSENHPARYAMVELVNIHDPGLSFEPIHRVVKGVDPERILSKFNTKIEESSAFNLKDELSIIDSSDSHSIGFITKDRCGTLVFAEPVYDLEVETLDEIIDDYLVEYEHDPEIVEKLGKEEGNIGFLLPSLKKSEFFALIREKGVLPRKSFSLWKENEKRYYIEARKIDE